MSARPFTLFALAAALVLAGCGSATTPTKPTKPVKTARALNAPFTFKVSGSAVTVAIDAAQGPSTTAEPVQLACAKLAAHGFSDRDEARATWPVGKRSTTFTLPRAADGLDLCAIAFTAHSGKQAIAFFSEQAKAKYLADQAASG